MTEPCTAFLESNLCAGNRVLGVCYKATPRGVCSLEEETGRDGVIGLLVCICVSCVHIYMKRVGMSRSSPGEALTELWRVLCVWTPVTC